MTNQADIQKTLQSWADFQKNTWDNWLQSLEKSKDASPDALWSEGLERWKESVEKTLDYQADSLKTWARGLEEYENTPPEMKEWASDGVAMVEGWVDAERDLWKQWFELVGSAPGASGNPMQVTTDQWRQFGEKMLEMQSNMSAAWMKSISSGGKK